MILIHEPMKSLSFNDIFNVKIMRIRHKHIRVYKDKFEYGNRINEQAHLIPPNTKGDWTRMTLQNLNDKYLN